jgi:outer membrane protein assembly factor BamE (lipoprotein component of BamABCDE complex)
MMSEDLQAQTGFHGNAVLPPPDRSLIMKKNILKLALVTLTVGVSAAASLPALASLGFVPENAQDRVQPGETRDQVIQALGTPRSTPKWANGETSLVYSISNGTESADEALYVDLDSSGKVLAVSLLDNSDDN